MINYKNYRYCLVSLMVFLCLINTRLLNAADTKNNVIHNSGIESVRIDDPVSKIFSVFESKYQIKNDYLTVTLLENGKKVALFTFDEHKIIFQIDIYARYITEQNIGCGSKLSDLIKAYGQGKIEPTDSGYFVWFKKQKGIMFLLNNDDIPKELRNIPDDVIKSKDEKRIMSLGNARISAIQIFKTFREDDKRR